MFSAAQILLTDIATRLVSLVFGIGESEICFFVLGILVFFSVMFVSVSWNSAFKKSKHFMCMPNWNFEDHMNIAIAFRIFVNLVCPVKVLPFLLFLLRFD